MIERLTREELHSLIGTRVRVSQESWPQSRLAELLGVSVRAVKHWEAGSRNPSGPALILLDMLKGETRGKKKNKK